MTDQERSSNVSLKFTYDRAAQAQVKQAIDAIRKELGGLSGDTAKNSVEMKRLAEASKLIGRDQSIQVIAKEYVNLGKAIKDDTAALKLMRQGLREIGSADSEINKATRAFKEMQNEIDKAKAKSGGSGLGQAEGLLSRGGASLRGLGLGGAADAVSGVADALQLAEVAKGLAGVAGGFSSVIAAMGPFAPLLVGGAAILGAIAIAQQKYNDELKAGEEAIAKAISDKEKYYTAVYTMDSEQAKQAIEDAKVQRRIFNDVSGDIRQVIKERAAELAKTNAAFASMTPEQQDTNLRSRDEFKELFKQLDAANGKFGEANNFIHQLTEGLKKGAFALGDAKTAAEKAAEAEKKLTEKRLDAARAIGKSIQDDIEKRKQTEEKKNQDMVSALNKRDADILAIESRGAQAEIDLKKRTADKVAEILQKEVDAASAALTKLTDRQSDLLREDKRGTEKDDRQAAFDDLQSQIDARRQERDDLVSHLRKVKEIKKSFDADERDAIYDRNFDALFRLQEQKQDELAKEDEANKERAADREQALKDEQSDTARRRQHERNERRIALQHALDDAHAGYVKELSLARQAKDRELQLANAAAIAELAMLQNKIAVDKAIRMQAAIDELTILNQTESEKRKIFQESLAQVRQLLGISAPAPTTNYPRPIARAGRPAVEQYAEGSHGSSVGQPFIYNEPESSGNESFGGYKLPGGMGLAIPFKSGNVDAGSSGGDVYVTNQIVVQGSTNPTLTAQEVVRISDERSKIRIKQALGMRRNN